MAEHCKISAALVSEEKSYVLKVDGYWRAKGLLETGKHVLSTPFIVGGHSWAVRYYPNGDNKDSANFISLFLCLQSADAEDMTAKFTVSVLGKNGELVPRSSRTFLHTFSREKSTWGCSRFFKRANLERSEHLIDDCLTIRCDVTIMKEIHSEESRRFFAHRCVLAARSSVFKAELLGAMKENSGSPIEICDMEPDVFKSLLHFVYTDSLPPALDSASNKGGDVVMSGHLLVAADRYNIKRLKLICEEKLCNHIDSEMVATSLALADQHGFHGLKEACLKFLDSPSNLEAMMASDGFEHLKSSCPSVLKELIARIMPAELKAAKNLIMEML
ncbi:unnamed protein product [Alopecurus aequalis]